MAGVSKTNANTGRTASDAAPTAPPTAPLIWQAVPAAFCARGLTSKE